MPNIVQNYNETTNDPEYPLTYEEAILDPDGNPIKGYVKEAVVAPQYDPTTGTYAVGDPVMDDKKYYRCNTAVASPEDFDPTKWTEKTISEEIDGLNQNLTAINYTSSNTRVFAVNVAGQGLRVLIPTITKGTSATVTSPEIFINSTWVSVTHSETQYRDNGVMLSFTTTASIANNATYLLRANISITCENLA